MTAHRVKSLALFLFVLVLMDGLLAQAYKLVRDPDETAALMENERRFRIASPVYHHDLAPNAVGEVIWGARRYPLRTNSLGFRDRQPRQVPLRPDSPRVILMGDSFTEGVGVPFEDSFAGLLAGRLSGVEVLNAGVVSYSPAIYFVKLKHLIEQVGLQFHRVVVFIDISDVEDEAVYYRLRDGKVIRIKKETGRSSFAARFKAFVKSNSLLARTVDLFIDARRTGTGRERSLWTVDDALFAEYGADGLRRAAENMNRLHRLLAGRGIGLAVAVHPWPDQVVAGDRQSRQVSFWRQWSRDHRVPFLDLFPLFVSDKDPLQVLRAYFIRGDIHWNEAGHRLVADEVLTRLGPWLRRPEAAR